MSRRMIDHLLADGAVQQDIRTRTLYPYPLAELVAPDGRPALPQAEVYVLDTVTRYLYEEVAQEDWGVQDFPHCAPPGPVFWMETRAPRWMVNETGRRAWDGQYAWGALFLAAHVPAALRQPDFPHHAHEGLDAACAGAWRAVQVACARHAYPLPAEEPPEGAPAWVTAAPYDVQHAVAGLREALQAHEAVLDLFRTNAVQAALHDIRWAYTVLPFFQMEKTAPIVWPGLVGVLQIDTAGWLVEVPTCSGGRNIGHWLMTHGEYVTAEEQQQYLTLGRVSLYPMLLALSWMQDAATTLRTVDPCHQRGTKHPRQPCTRRHYTTLGRREHEV